MMFRKAKLKDFPLSMKLLSLIDMDSGASQVRVLNPDADVYEMELLALEVTEKACKVFEDFGTINKAWELNKKLVEQCSWWGDYKTDAAKLSILECMATPQDDMGLELPLILGISSGDTVALNWLTNEYFDGMLGPRFTKPKPKRATKRHH